MAEQKEMKTLAKETAIYGLSSIVGKFLNWLLVPLYTFVLQQQSDYGIVTNLYAWTALLLVILVYGMETGFFRFANKEGADPAQVYTTALTSLGTTSLLFAVVCVALRQQIASALGYAEHSEFIAMLGVVVAMDAFGALPFSYLRYKRKAMRFAALKLFMIFMNIAFNLFFLLLCPKIQDCAAVSWFYRPDYGVGYVFVSNLLSTLLVTLALLPEIVAEKYSFSWALLRRMLRYSLPLLVLGIAGIMNQTLDKILFPFIYPGNAQAELGIYGACFKVAMVMMMFTQAFRYAYEPFVFSKHKDRNSVAAYADAMKYFVIFSLLILLGMTFYLDLLKYIIAPSYWSGLRAVPIVLWAYVFQGVFFNVSLWYKLTDKTAYGAWFSLLGCVITLAVNVIFVPRYSYMASATASLVCYFVIMVLSWAIGQKHLPVPYDLKRIGGYFLLTIVLLAAYYGVRYLCDSTVLRLCVGTVLLAIYIVVVVRCDFPLSGLPVVGKYFRRADL
ncbi:MAG: polysaccharide biosynthesis C-terminal domain-containing protein [Paludibacter sp.]|nr:polysaccharide biosynthesis C-terminal domain-containing protein [Bacteroidales bacterium]MCM1069924.1 polysaccharide biosynthesis C-terminal domain-containing protein [Prevotella sp.]MCM1354659.1 polysaccharide biosynthesis C-terminal domain-containing protein [Bacteroides sp.]MCM1443500.1 polysaccharide biosynthesis C-terminal domain-containing protein [Muribaculum sp.]MCM1482606.1 polysaccharide biosynthesis C-terminal domain-containing protein [Paludibacter sp.]